MNHESLVEMEKGKVGSMKPPPPPPPNNHIYLAKRLDRFKVKTLLVPVWKLL